MGIQVNVSTEPSGVRALARLETLFGMGVPPHANRPGLSPSEQQAYEQVADWMRKAGMVVEYDDAGNLFGRLLGQEPGLPEVWTGSHLDTVPSGGRFDGALGVVAAVEAVSLLGIAHSPRRTIAVVAFRDEEGWRFGRGFFGSRAICGQLTEEEFEARDSEGVSVKEALRRLSIEVPDLAGWLPHPLPFCFVEAHIEQGPNLARAGTPVGIVSGIAGMSGFAVSFEGRSGHAGTTPMDGRADALSAAARMINYLDDGARKIEGAVVTVGQLSIEPGAANVIPGRTTLSVDARAPESATLRSLETAVRDAGQMAAEDSGCQVQLERIWHNDPVPMSDLPTDVLREAMKRNGQPVTELVSGAGHDAAVVATGGVPTGMLFVRSLASGVSHTPEESTDESAITQAVSILADSLRVLGDAE